MSTGTVSRFGANGAGMGMAIERPRLANLHGQVAEAIALRVMGGAYADADALPTEGALCTELDVSRTTLREAMKNLAAKGLVEVAPSRGTRVRPRRVWNLLDADVLRWRVSLGVDAKLVADIYEMRQCFEPEASGLAAERATDAERGMVETHLRDLVRWTSAADAERAAEADVMFHVEILAATHNEFLASFAAAIETALRLSFRLARRRVPMSAEDIALHRAVARAICQQRPAAARAATTRLLAHSRNAQIAAVSVGVPAPAAS